MAKKVRGKHKMEKDHLDADINLTLHREEPCREEITRNDSCSKSKRKACYSPLKTPSYKKSVKSFQVEEHFEDMFHVLDEFQRDNKHCDLMIKTKGGIVNAHSIVIMAATPSLFSTLDKHRSVDKDDKICIDLSHVPDWIVEDFIAFIYSGNLQLTDNNIVEFSRFIKSVGLTKLYKQLESTSAELHKHFDTHIDETAVGKTSSPSTNHQTSLKSDCCKRQDSTPLKQCNSTRTLRRNGIQQSAQIKPVTNETNYEDTKKDESLAIKNLSNRKGLILKRQSPVNEKEVGEPALSESTSDEIRSINKHLSKDVQTNEHESGQGESNLSKAEELPDDDGESYDMSENNDSDSGTDTEYSSPKKTAKLSYENKNEFMEDGTNKTSNNISNRLCCKRCSETFDTVDLLKKHRKICKGNRPRKRCILCQVSFSTAEEYLHHRKTDEKCLEIQSEKHKRRLEKKAELRARYSCRVCPRKFRRVADHIDHEFVSHELPYDKEKWPDLYCEYCQYWTMNPWRLHHHKTYDCSKGQDYICDVCGNKYKNEKTLKCHKDMQHTDALPLLPCDQCGKILKGHKGLKHHIRIMHKGENPHKRHMCHFCSMKYASAGDLTFHLHRSHSQPLPEGFLTYQCEDCDYFRYQCEDCDYFRYQCEDCDYFINNKRTYQKHRQLHQDQRDFQCEICPKAFKTKNSLHNHMKSHIGKKMPCPYDGCSYGALKNCHLKSHIRNQHTQKGVKNEECHMCPYSTFFRGNLIKHLRTVHQLEVVTRYSVQMKAKYKHLKTGHIVGKMDTPELTKVKTKTADSKSEISNDGTSLQGTSNTESNTGGQLNEGQVGISFDGFVQSSKETGHLENSQEKYQLLAKVTTAQGQMDNRVDSQVLHSIEHNIATPSNMGHGHNVPYLYAVNSMHAANMNQNGASDMNVMYTNSQVLQGSPTNHMTLSVPHTVSHAAPHEGSIRGPELTTMPQVLSDNGKSGVASLPVMFHPQVTNDEENNAKMLTYLQI